MEVILWSQNSVCLGLSTATTKWRAILVTSEGMYRHIQLAVMDWIILHQISISSVKWLHLRAVSKL